MNYFKTDLKLQRIANLQLILTAKIRTIEELIEVAQKEKDVINSLTIRNYLSDFLITNYKRLNKLTEIKQNITRNENTN